MMSEQNFDLVLLDIKLPDISGFNILKEIRHRFQVRVIAQTAFAMDIVKECKLAGFDDCLIKPVEMDELLRKIAKYLL
jgi:two-component system aerobic respiration control sensor histidine kinase ArcB